MPGCPVCLVRVLHITPRQNFQKEYILSCVVDGMGTSLKLKTDSYFELEEKYCFRTFVPPYTISTLFV